MYQVCSNALRRGTLESLRLCEKQIKASDTSIDTYHDTYGDTFPLFNLLGVLLRTDIER